MKNLIRIIILSLSALILFSTATWSDEGMWLLDAITRLPLGEMKNHGLELTPEQIFSNTSPSVKDAIVLLSGGTASFISSGGLVITNHHVAFSGIQQLSSLTDDYLKNGFYAKARSEELSTSYTAEIIETMKDVTDSVLSVTIPSMTPEERTRTVQARVKEVEDAVQNQPGHFSRVVAMYNGVKYYLFTSVRLPDVRLVYAPPSAIGNFGGEVDNWQWPRHTGDFSLMRVYVGPDGTPAKYAKENVPFKPKKFLPVSTQGYSEGSFSMVMGFPGRTYRYRDAAGVEFDRDESLPLTIDLYKTRMDIIATAMQKDRSTGIKYASAFRRVANFYKKDLAILDGIRRADLLAMKKADENKFASYIAASPDLTSRYGSLMNDMRKAYDELRSVESKDQLLTNLLAGVNTLRIANRVASFVDTQFHDSLGNSVEPTEKQQTPVLDFAKSTLKDTDPSVDKQICTSLLLKSEAMADQQLVVVKDICGGKTGSEMKERIQSFVDDLYDESSLTSTDGCAELLTRSARKINKDAFVEFARKIAVDQRPTQSKVQSITATLNRLREHYVNCWMEWKRSDLTYPDANRTLRLTYGKVQSLSPHDAVHYSFETTLAGVIEKESGEDPFVVPRKLKDLWHAKNFGRYADHLLHDVPVAFITDNDITNGNSGSPVINGKGELIGCAFDGNWDGVVGDYYFQEEFNRTICVDARYVLFVLDKFSGAQTILDELIIH